MMSRDRGHHASDSLTSWMAGIVASNRWRPRAAPSGHLVHPQRWTACNGTG